MADKLVQFKGTVYEEGWGMVAKKVMKNRDITIGARCLYAYLCTFVKQGSGTAFPGRDKICFDLNINKNTFNKYRTELTQSGYIVVTQNREKKKFGNNVYSIETIQQCTKKQDTEKQDTEKQDTEKVDSKSTSSKNTNSKNTNIYNPQFLEWYEIYPNKFNKEQSFKSFNKLLKEESFENIMKATNNYIKDLKQKGTDKQYIVRSTNFVGTKKAYQGYLEMDLSVEESTPKTGKVEKSIDALKNMDLEG